MCPSLDTGCPKARETAHLLQLPTVHDNIGSDVVRTDLVIILLFDTLTSILHAFALSTSLLRVLKVTIAAAHKIGVIGESDVRRPWSVFCMYSRY